jgi:hypothetical protein
MGRSVLNYDIHVIHAWVRTFLIPRTAETQAMIRNVNQTIVLEPRDYIIGAVSGTPSLCLAWPQALPPNNVGVDWQFGTFPCPTLHRHLIETQEFRS